MVAPRNFEKDETESVRAVFAVVASAEFMNLELCMPIPCTLASTRSARLPVAAIRSAALGRDFDELATEDSEQRTTERGDDRTDVVPESALEATILVSINHLDDRLYRSLGGGVLGIEGTAPLLLRRGERGVSGLRVVQGGSGSGLVRRRIRILRIPLRVVRLLGGRGGCVMSPVGSLLGVANPRDRGVRVILSSVESGGVGEKRRREDGIAVAGLVDVFRDLLGLLFELFGRLARHLVERGGQSLVGFGESVGDAGNLTLQRRNVLGHALALVVPLVRKVANVLVQAVVTGRIGDRIAEVGRVRELAHDRVEIHLELRKQLQIEIDVHPTPPKDPTCCGSAFNLPSARRGGDEQRSP